MICLLDTLCHPDLDASVNSEATPAWLGWSPDIPLDLLLHMFFSISQVVSSTASYPRVWLLSGTARLMSVTQRLCSAYVAVANIRQQQGLTVSPHGTHTGLNAEQL